MLLMLFHVQVGNLHCFCQPDDSIYILSSAAHVALLCAAKNKWLNPYAAVDVKKSNSFWSMKLMGSAADKMHIRVLQIKAVMSHRLNGVGMKNSMVLFADLPCSF